MKKLVTGILTTALVISMNIPAFAGQWQSDANGWWWQNDNGAYPANTWQWIDGNGDGVAESYYFNEQGYCLINTITPDGYTVDQNGAWMIDGVIQTQNVNIQSTAETQPTLQANTEVPNVAGTYTGIYNGKTIKAVFEQDGNTIWAEIDYFLKDEMPGYKGDGLFENEWYSFQFMGSSSLLFKDLSSGESVYFVKQH